MFPTVGLESPTDLEHTRVTTCLEVLTFPGLVRLLDQWRREMSVPVTPRKGVSVSSVLTGPWTTGWWVVERDGVVPERSRFRGTTVYRRTVNFFTVSLNVLSFI